VIKVSAASQLVDGKQFVISVETTTKSLTSKGGRTYFISSIELII
jgi:hypothetical protein